MLFYPDQFFYSKGPQRESRHSHSRHQGNNRGFRRNVSEDDEDPSWFNQYQWPVHAARPQRHQIPEEYIVLDEDELNALRSFREAKRRTSEREQYERAQLARRKAESERKAREIARREAEARMQAQIEANARAAAREYLRRQQARQQALLEAQQEERQRRQQYVMEQLRQQFGLFAVPTPASFQGAKQAGDDEEDGSAAPVPSQTQEEVQQPTEKQKQDESHAEENETKAQRNSHDPIRSLIEALAPYPFIVATESSDEEEPQQTGDNQSEVSDNDSAVEDPRSVEFVLEPDSAFGGPTCETASEDSEPIYIEEPEFHVRSATPPIPVDYDSAEDGSSLKDRRKERQTSAPVDHLKKAKTKGSYKEAKKGAKREAKKDRKDRKDRSKANSSKEPKAPATATKQATSAEISGLLNALSDELKRLKDAYARLSSAKPTNDLHEIISRLEAVKIGYGRSEEIYNKLDEVRAGKDERKLKHEITTDSVALADKYEELLNQVYAEKKEISANNSPRETPKNDASASAASASASAAAAAEYSNAETSPKHEVVLEEVQDESD